MTYPLDLKFAPLVTLVQRYVSEFLWFFHFKEIGGTGQSDRRTVGVHCNA